MQTIDGGFAESTRMPNGSWSRRRGLFAAIPGTLLLSVLLLASPVGAVAPAVSASTGVWAWGAYYNSTTTTIYIGDYAVNLGLVGGNLSAATAYVAEYASSQAVYAAYTVMNVTAPTSTTRTVVTSAIAVANVTDLIVVNGTLPAGGRYSPGSTVTLANDTSIWYYHSLTIWAYRLWSNYSLTSGALSLENEQLRLFGGVNASAIAWHVPSYTAGSGGSTIVSYPTDGWAEIAYSAEVANLSFAPSVPLAKFPLKVGNQWNATSNATVTGATAYEVAGAASMNGTNTTSWNAGGSSLNTTVSLAFGFAVTGSTTVRYPNGTEETAYSVSSSVNGGSGGYAVWDGLAVLPAGGPVPVAPARPAGPLAPKISSSGPSTVAIVASSGMPVGAHLAVGTSTTLLAAPLPASTASNVIQATPAPARPTGSPTLPGTTVPPVTGSHPPQPVLVQAPSNGQPVIASWQLGAVLGTLLAALVVVDRLRARRPKA